MASSDYRKDDFMEDNRTDSGIESFRSIVKDEPFNKTVRDPTPECNESRDKFSTTDERLDSAYGSSSLTVESLSEIVEDCSISKTHEDERAESTELDEQEENWLTTITEDGDTYVFSLTFIIVGKLMYTGQQAISVWCQS